MKPNQVLLLDPNPSATCIVTNSGRPVWPVRTPDEYTALTQLARLFAATTEESRGRPGRSAPGPDVVVALGKGVEPAAALYAHLTERQLQSVSDLTALATSPPPAVVVTTSEWVDERLLESLYGTQSASAPGVIWSDTPEALRCQVLVRAAASVLCGPVTTPWIDFSPIEHITWNDAHAREVLTFRDSPHRIRAALETGAAVLHICTHADGIDADLGPELILCPFGAFSDDKDRQRSPRCWITNHCHRRNVPVPDAMNSGALLSPDVLRARVLVWNVCFGLLHPHGEVGNEWGLTARMLNKAVLGAVITPLGVVFTNPNVLEPLCRALVRGIPLGEAVARFNRSRKSCRLGLRMCLLGDPRLRLPRQNLVVRRPKTTGGDRVTTFNTLSTSDIGDVAFLRAFFMQILSYETGTLASLALASVNAVFSYERAAWTGRELEQYREAPGPMMRKTVLKFLICQEYNSDDGTWLALAKSVRRQMPAGQCFLCGRRTVSIVARLRVIGVSPRRLTVCPRCGMIEDAPIRSEIRFSVNGSVVRLEGDVPQNACAAGLALKSKYVGDSIGWEWPCRPDGGLVDAFAIPGPWPRGPMDIYIYVLWGGSITILSTECRGEG